MSDPKMIVPAILFVAGISAPGVADQYADLLIEEGFDCQDALVLVTGSDLDAIGMKRGHKRLLLKYLSTFKAHDAVVAASTTVTTSSSTVQAASSTTVAAAVASEISTTTKTTTNKRKTGPGALTKGTPSKRKIKALSGTAICVSGQMSLIRKQFQALLKENGSVVQSTVTNSTTHLVTTASEVLNPTRKVIAAMTKKIPIVSEEFVSDSIAQCELLDETPYLLHEDEAEDDNDDDQGSETKKGKSKASTSSSSSSPKKTSGKQRVVAPNQGNTKSILSKHAKRKLNSRFTKMSSVTPQPNHARDASNVMLAKKFTLPDRWQDFSINHKSKLDISGWWLSEKLDGVRAYWSGTHFYSRNGNVFPAPEWFTRHLPSEPLDGELWCGRRLFQRALSIVKNQGSGQLWKYISYQVFDAPQMQGKFEERYEKLKELIQPITDKAHAMDIIDEDDELPNADDDADDSEDEVAKLVPHVSVVGMIQCKNLRHLLEELKDVESKGGEGLMLRMPKSAYDHGARSSTLLKVKTVSDEEAIVVGHEGGSGKNQGRCGALTLRTPDGREFSCGTGMTDAVRKNPPAIGAMVTYRYTELMNNGFPRFPVFIGEREDLDWDEYVENYEPPTAPQDKGLRLGRNLSIMYPHVTRQAS